MGIAASKCYAKHISEPKDMRVRICQLEEELKEMTREKEQKELSFAFQKSKHKEEVSILRRKLEEEEEAVRRLEAAAAPLQTSEKWKQLYLAIKTDLDELILRTNEGNQFCRGSEQGAVINSLKKELKDKEEGMESLRTKLKTMEKDGERREREIDILRQSLRILSNAKRNRGKRNAKRVI